MAGSEYYDHTTYPSTGAAGSSSAMRSELDLIEAGFGKLPTLVGSSLKIVGVNSGETALVPVATTGTGSVVLATSPTLVTPVLGVATATTINKVTITAPASGSTLTIADGKVLTASNTLTLTGTDSSSVAFGTGGTVAYTANKLSVFASTTSAELAGVISNESGSGLLVFNDTPTLIAPLLGTPTSGVLTNCTGLPAASITGLGTGVATFLATPTSANLIAAVTNETGTGALVFADTPTLVTPAIGVATATSINKVTITAPASSATLTIADGKTLTVNHTLTLTGTSGTTHTFPSTSATLARTDAAQSFTGTQTFSGLVSATLGLNVTGAAFSSLGIADNATANIITISSAGRTTIAPSTTLTGTTQYALVLNPTFTSASTTAGNSIYVGATTAAAAYTQVTQRGVYVDDATLGAGSAITNLFGFQAADQTKGGTLNVGYSGVVTSGTGKWNCYMSGSASNAFAGSVRIGSTVAPTVALDVTGAIAASGALTALTINGHTFTAGSSTFTGTAAQTYTFPTTTATIARTDAAQTFTGIQTFSSAPIIPGFSSSAAGATTLSADSTQIQMTWRNTNTGTSAQARVDLGNNASSTASTWGVYGSNHATKPGTVEFGNQANASLILLTNGNASLTITGAGAATFASSLVVTTTLGVNGQSTLFSGSGNAVIVKDANTTQGSVQFSSAVATYVIHGGADYSGMDYRVAASMVHTFRINTTVVSTIDASGNFIQGAAGTAGATAAGTVCLINTATAPTTSVDRAHLYSADVSAGNAVLALFQEMAPYAGVAVASTTKIPIIVNGVTYYVLATTVA